MRRETSASEAAAALQERIWDIHGKLSHAILSLSACARRRAAPACRRCAPSGCVVVKDRWPPAPGGEDGDLPAPAPAPSPVLADLRSLHAIRAALEDLEGHLHFLHNVQSQQRVERDAAIAKLQQSRVLLATRLAEHRGKRHGVIEEALAFVNNVLDESRFVQSEDVHGMHKQSGDKEKDPKEHGSNMVVRVLSCGFVLAKNSLQLEKIGGVLGNAAVFAVSMLAFLQLNQVALVKQAPHIRYRGINDRFHSERLRDRGKGKHLEVLLARG